MDLTAKNIQNLIIDKAADLGFFKTGFAKYQVLDRESENLKKWLSLGYGADMDWIKRGYDKRKDVRLIMPEAKSVISLAYNYYTPFEHDDTKPKISRYALGRDYHKVLKPKLKEMCKFISSNFEEATAKAYVDDGPVMDKAWAQKAGIGWMGKHSNIINPEYGSWFFICTVITNIEFDNYSGSIEDLCGSCTLCVSACPTGAITSEYVVDANKCISYQTIENRGKIPAEINLDGWIFGCDVCQDVCPYNSPKYNHITEDDSFRPLPILNESEKALKSITEEKFDEVFINSPIKRTKFSGWRRNLERVKI